MEYRFTYDQEGRLDRLSLINRGIAGDRADPGFADRALDDRERARHNALRGFFANSAAPLELLCCTDQVGTLRALIKAGTLSANSWTMKDIIAEAYAKCDPHKIAHHMPTGAPNPNGELTGWEVKEIRRDSFGNPYYDSFPEFFLPIGFAGGLEDPDTGLVRFGWRDYDPAVGRFTAPDPLGDTGGDHDLYDYCVDDPVSCVDPAGLFPGSVMARVAASVIPGRAFLESIKEGAKAALLNTVFCKTANAPEEMMDVRQDILSVEKKMEEGNATKDDMSLLEKRRKRENELWQEFGSHYGDEFYLRYFPDPTYVEKKRRQYGK